MVALDRMGGFGCKLSRRAASVKELLASLIWPASN
jgi:hypothetical protein